MGHSLAGLLPPLRGAHESDAQTIYDKLTEVYGKLMRYVTRASSASCQLSFLLWSLSVSPLPSHSLRVRERVHLDRLRGAFAGPRVYARELRCLPVCMSVVSWSGFDAAIAPHTLRKRARVRRGKEARLVVKHDKCNGHRARDRSSDGPQREARFFGDDARSRSRHGG